MTGISGKPSRVTLYDVAAAAAVSKSTVSRILDERLPRSSSETAERVRRIAKELGYVRDASAAGLRRGSTQTIGIIVPKLTDTVMAMIYEALARSCERAGLFAIVATSDDKPRDDLRAAKTLLNRGVDGLILATARLGDDFTELEAKGVPYVLVLRTNGSAIASLGDDRLGGYLATRHLLDLGHRRIAMITGHSDVSSAAARQEGYRAAMEEAGADIEDSWVVGSEFGIEGGADAVSRLMSHPEKPTAIFAVNDHIAVGAISGIASMGLSIPHDVSIVGYNDIPIVRHLATPLTTVRVPFDQIAAAAIELLQSGNNGLDERIRIATPTLLPRRSTAPVAADRRSARGPDS